MKAIILLTFFIIAMVTAVPLDSAFVKRKIDNKLSNDIDHGEHVRARRQLCNDDAPCIKICNERGIDGGRCALSGTCQCISGAGDRACNAKCVSDGFGVGKMMASGVCACRDNWDGW